MSVTKEDWLFDESVNFGEEFRQSDDVAAYDTKAGTSAEMERDLIRRLGLGGSDIVADVGAGTGHFAFQAARVCAHVYAIEVSPAMVALMQRKLANESPQNVTIVPSGILQYQHIGQPLDVVVTKNTLHHLPDFWKVEALLNIYNMLREDGRLYLRDLVFSFPPREFRDYINHWIDGGSDDPREGWSKAEFKRHVREEFSTYTWVMEDMLEHVGFDIVEKTTSENCIFASYLCTRKVN